MATASSTSSVVTSSMASASCPVKSVRGAPCAAAGSPCAAASCTFPASSWMYSGKSSGISPRICSRRYTVRVRHLDAIVCSRARKGLCALQRMQRCRSG